jgi:tetratricopeptide (TPR) repeat protein
VDTAPRAADATRPAPRDAAYYRQAARWGVAAAEALEHAHAMGIVHRDIKPANLLMDGAGKLWVADFGLARTAADTGLTMTGDVLGTLRYMSPEQAPARHGLVDHRTDVYALGATLYELLTGRPAVAGADRAEVLRNLVFEEPAAPRSVDRGIPADLETVVLKTLAKEPADRYATAKELADDLRRFLEQRPVLARRPTLAQRAGKWAQRHRRLVGAVLVLVLAALAGLATSTALIWTAQSRTETARKDAQEKRELAEKREAEADAQRRRAEDNLRTVLRLVTSQQDLLRIVEANPGSKVRPENLAGWLEELIGGLEKVRADGLDDPEHLWRLAAAYSQLGGAHSEAQRLTQAESAYHQAATIWASIGTNFPTYRDAGVAPILGATMLERQADVQRADGRLAEAESSYREALRIYGTVSLKKGPTQKTFEAVCLCGLARCLLAGGRVQEAEGLYGRAMQADPKRDIVHIEYAWFLATRPDAAHRDPGRAIALLKPLLEPPLGNTRASLVLGVALYSAGDWKAAATTLSKSVQQHEGLENGAGFVLAMAHWRLGEKNKAREQCEGAISWTDQHRPKDLELHRFHAEAVRLLGLEQLESARLYLAKGQLAAAAGHFSAAFAADPTLVEDPRITRRAAACAARAGCGQGKDAGLLDAMECARLRQNALAWLRAHLAQWARRLDREPQHGQAMQEDLESLQKSMLFACVRDREALAKLPEAEREQWQQLWVDIADTLAKAKGKPAPG